MQKKTKYVYILILERSISLLGPVFGVLREWQVGMGNEVWSCQWMSEWPFKVRRYFWRLLFVDFDRVHSMRPAERAGVM